MTSTLSCLFWNLNIAIIRAISVLHYLTKPQDYLFQKPKEIIKLAKQIFGISHQFFKYLSNFLSPFLEKKLMVNYNVAKEDLHKFYLNFLKKVWRAPLIIKN